MQRLLGKRAAVLALSLAGILGLGILDYLTPFEFDVFLFYSFPVALAAWAVGRRAGVLTALLAVAAWVGAHFLESNPYSSSFYAGWNTVLHGGWILLVALSIARIRADLDRERQLNADLGEALEQVKVLQGLLPVCAWCHRIRDAGGHWGELESYIRKHTDAEFTHGICPACKARMLKECEARTDLPPGAVGPHTFRPFDPFTG